MRDDGDEAGGAARHPREVQAIVARVVLQAGAVHALHAGLDVARGVLDAEDARVLGQDVEGRVGEGDARAARDVVEHDGQIGRIRDGAHVGAQALLGGAVVVRGDDQQAVRTVLLSALADAHRVRGVIGAGAAQDERTIPHGLAHGVRQVVLFGLVGRGRLSRRAGQEDRVAAFVDQLGREALRGDQVNVAGGRHGGDHGGREGAEAAGRNVRHVPHLTHPRQAGPPPPVPGRPRCVRRTTARSPVGP